MHRFRLAVICGALLVAACSSDANTPGGTGGASAGGRGGGSGGAGSIAGAGGDGAGGLPGGAGGGAPGGTGGQASGGGGGVDQCAVALPVACGDRLNHNTLTQGRANAWTGYDKTARAESGRETVYAFSSENACMVVARLTNLTVDLDLMLLSACDPIRSNTMASSTPLDLQTVETVSWINSPHQTYYLVVDGYAAAEGSYTIELDCTCL
jgi:hypothetical protein